MYSSSSCDTVYNNVLLPSYVLIIISSILLLVLKELFNTFIKPCGMKVIDIFYFRVILRIVPPYNSAVSSNANAKQPKSECEDRGVAITIKNPIADTSRAGNLTKEHALQPDDVENNTQLTDNKPPIPTTTNEVCEIPAISHTSSSTDHEVVATSIWAGAKRGLKISLCTLEPHETLFTRKSDDPTDPNDAVVEYLEKESLSSFAFFCVQVGSSWVTFLLALGTYDMTIQESNWTRYTNIYGIYINSNAFTPTVTVLLLYYFLGEQDAFSEGQYHEDYHYDKDDLFPNKNDEIVYLRVWYLSLVPLAPVLVTHIIPGIFLYSWLWLSILGLLFGWRMLWEIVWLELKERDVDELITRKLSNLIFSVGFRIAMVLVLQSTFNYTAAFFENPTAYEKIIARDYKLHSQTTCIMQKYDENIQNGLVFFNWL